MVPLTIILRGHLVKLCLGQLEANIGNIFRLLGIAIGSGGQGTDHTERRSLDQTSTAEDEAEETRRGDEHSTSHLVLFILHHRQGFCDETYNAHFSFARITTVEHK